MGSPGDTSVYRFLLPVESVSSVTRYPLQSRSLALHKAICYNRSPYTSVGYVEEEALE
jgi:hypothetical protein